MAFPYDPSLVVDYFDELAEGEWDRLERDPEPKSTSRSTSTTSAATSGRGEGGVLEVGAGAGRFTVELARLGCSVLVADVSSVQLDLNRQKEE